MGIEKIILFAECCGITAKSYLDNSCTVFCIYFVEGEKKNIFKTMFKNDHNKFIGGPAHVVNWYKKMCVRSSTNAANVVRVIRVASALVTVRAREWDYICSQIEIIIVIIRVQVDIPTCHFSERFLFRTVFIPNCFVSRGCYSERFYSERFLLRKFGIKTFRNKKHSEK